MGDCPNIKKEGIPDKSVGKYKMSWGTCDGEVTQEVKLCLVCRDEMREKGVIQPYDSMEDCSICNQQIWYCTCNNDSNKGESK